MGCGYTKTIIAGRSMVGVLVFLLAGCAGANNVTPSDLAAGQASTGATKGPTASGLKKVSSPPTTAPPKATVTPSPIQTGTSGGITLNIAGAILPNAARTPGAVNPTVTQTNIGQTICVSGWTATVRPDSSVTTELKKEQLGSGYAYKGDTATGDYEEDHLISLEIGGAPNAEANLWPQPYNSPEGARVKDVVENKLHSLVCDHAITLATAQKAIATNWWVAYQYYVGGAVPAPAQQAPAQPQAPPPAPAGGATALCNDGSYSFAAHHQGACSRHDGVKVFYK